MTEKEAINTLNNYLAVENKWRNRFNKGTLSEAIETVLQLLEQKDNKINKVIDKLKEEADENNFNNRGNDYDYGRKDLAIETLKILEE